MAKSSRRSKRNQKKQESFAEGFISWIKTVLGAIVVVMIINGLAVASFVVPTGSMEKTVLPGDFLFVNKFIYGPSTPQVIPFLNQPLPFYKFPGFKHPDRGDVIVFIYPGDRDDVEPDLFQYYLKRCIAIAGDTIEIKNKKVYIDGQYQEYPELVQFSYSFPMVRDDRARTYPKGAGFTGDNYGPIAVPKKGDVITLTPDNISQWKVLVQRETGKEVTNNARNVFLDGQTIEQYEIQENYCFAMGDNRDLSEDSRYWGFVPYENVVGTPMIIYWSWDPHIPLSNFGEKISSIRFDRIGKIIR